MSEELDKLLIKDEDFSIKMENEVLPYIKEKIHDDYVKTEDGISLHYQYLINDDEMGTILISHGYCEFSTKYYEMLYYFHKLGYSVFIVEHRGHGYSTRQVKGFSKVHVDRFKDYAKDFKVFYEEVKRIHKSSHYYLFAHSMGGAVGALYLETYPDDFEKAVLSSPMIKMSTKGVNPFVVKALCLLSYLPFCRKIYCPGQGEYDHSYKYPECSAISEARFKYQFSERERDEHFRSNGASLCWTREALNVSKKIIKNANLISNTVILLQASLDHLVEPQAQNDFADRNSNIGLIRFEGSKHEIFNATDEIIHDYYQLILDFLKQ